MYNGIFSKAFLLEDLLSWVNAGDECLNFMKTEYQIATFNAIKTSINRKCNPKLILYPHGYLKRLLEKFES